MTAQAAPQGQLNYPLGVTMMVMACLCLSTGGLILRHMESANVWQISFYRSIALTASLLVFLSIRYRGRLSAPFLGIGRAGLLVMVCIALGSIAYIVALSLTTVANVMFLLASAPLMTAALAWLLLGERVDRVTLLAMMGALAGIGIMVTDGLRGGHLTGNLVALFAALAFAVMVIAMRGARARDMVPASCLGGVLAAVICLPLVQPLTGGLVVSGHDLLLSILLGTVQVGAGFLLITLATRHIPAAEVALLALGEIILAPIWVWIFVAEVPSRLALIGGAILLSAVAGQALLRLRPVHQ
ncbi:MAG: DMT family transporter [Pseudomonadota bacterium]